MNAILLRLLYGKWYHGLAIPRAWYRAPKTPEIQRIRTNTKSRAQKYEKSPKNTSWSFLGHFRVLSVTFLLVVFFIFQGFLGSEPGPRNRKYGQRHSFLINSKMAHLCNCNGLWIPAVWGTVSVIGYVLGALCKGKGAPLVRYLCKTWE